MNVLAKDFFKPISNSAIYFYPYGRLSNRAKVIYGKENCKRLMQRIRELWLLSAGIGLAYYLVVYQWAVLSLPRGVQFVDICLLSMGFFGAYTFLCNSIQGDLHSRGIGFRSIVLRHANELGAASLFLRLGLCLGLGTGAIGYYIMLLLNYPNGVDTFLSGTMCFIITAASILLSSVYALSIAQQSESKAKIFE
ncbi:MAG: hypothetical protein VX278_12125 [Myxococcota bacterium]|nr:hypothetical protein [Myxococcota bacterium]